MSILSQSHSIIFDRVISAPGHGKEVVGGLNAIENLYMYQLMSTVQISRSKLFEKQNLMNYCIQEKDVSLSK